MSKLTPEALEELRKSDPAAFDDDVSDDNALSQGAPIEKTADEVADEQAAADKARDEKGRFAAKPDAKADDASEEVVTTGDEVAAEPAKPAVNMVPQPRVDELSAERNKEREGRIAAERRAADLEERLAAATKATERDYTSEITALEQKYDDGDVDFVSYQKERDALVAGQAQEAAIAAHNERTALQQAENNKRLFTEAQNRFFSEPDNAALANNPRKVAAFWAAIDEVPDAKDHDDLLAKAAVLVRSDFAPAPAATPAADPGAVRRADNARAAGNASNAPPPIAGGVGSRGGPDNVVDLKQLKPGKFSTALSREQQEALLGEGAV